MEGICLFLLKKLQFHTIYFLILFDIINPIIEHFFSNYNNPVEGKIEFNPKQADLDLIDLGLIEGSQLGKQGIVNL